MADKQIDILFNLKAVGDAGKNVKDLTKVMEELEAEAEATQKAIDEMISSGKDASQMQTALKTVKNTIKSTRDEIAKSEQVVKDYGEAWNQVRDNAEKMAQVGQTIAGVGAAITAPLLLAAKSYVDANKETEIVASKAADQQERIADSWERIGRVVVREFLPAMEQIASLSEDIASFVEANPGVASGIVNIGMVLTAAGALTAAIGQAAATVSTIQGLIGATGAAGAVGGGSAAISGAASAAAPAAVLTAAAASGAVIGREIGNAINSAIGQDQQSFGDIGRTFQVGNATFGPLGVLSQALDAVGADEAASNVWEFNKAMYGLNEQTQQAVVEIEKVAQKEAQWTQGMAAPLDVARAQQETSKANKKLAEEAETASKEAESAMKRFASQTENVNAIIQENAANEAKRAQERANIQQQAAIELQRLAEDHAANIRDIERRKNESITNAAEERDALAIDAAKARAEEEKATENERYSTERRRREEDLRNRLREFDQQARMQAEAERRKLEMAQQAAQRELDIAMQLEGAKLNIFSQSLAQILQMGASLGSILGSTSQNAVAQDTRYTSNTTNSQDIRIVMDGGQTLAQVRRELAANNRALMDGIAFATGGV